MRRLLFTAMLLFTSLCVFSQEKPDSLSIKPKSTEPTSIVSFPSSEYLILPRITASPFPMFNEIWFINMKADIARNVLIHRERFHLFKVEKRYFLTGLMPGLIMEPYISPAPEFDYKIFLDPNFDPRVYTIPTINTTYRNAQIFRNGQNPTDKINW